MFPLKPPQKPAEPPKRPPFWGILSKWVKWTKKRKMSVELGKFLIYLTIPLAIVFVTSQPMAQRALIERNNKKYGDFTQMVEPTDKEFEIKPNSNFHDQYEHSQAKIKAYLEKQKEK